MLPYLPPSHSPRPQAGRQPTSPKIIFSFMNSTTQVLKEKSRVILNFFFLNSIQPPPLPLRSPQILSIRPPKNLLNPSLSMFLTLCSCFQFSPSLYFILITVNYLLTGLTDSSLFSLHPFFLTQLMKCIGFFST